MDVLRGLGASASNTWLSRTGGLEDGDTEEDSYHMRVLHAYYRSPEFLAKGRPVPSWMPPDPKAPVKAAPVAMVSSSNQVQSNYGMPARQADTTSLRSRQQAAPTTSYSSSSKGSFIDSLPRNSQPVSAAAPAAPLSGAAKLKARYNNRTGSPTRSQTGLSNTTAASLRTQGSYDAPVGGAADDRYAAGGSYGRDLQQGRIGHSPAPPATSSNAPWSGGGDEYNGFSSYGSSSPFGDAGRSGAGAGRQGAPAGPRSGLVRGPRGM